MALTALLICLFVQRILHFDSHGRQFNWFEYYYEWMKARFSKSASWYGLLGVLTVVLPAFVIFILFAVFVYAVVGMIGYYILTLLVLWYYLDARPLVKENHQATARELLEQSYQGIFPIIFWLLIFGVSGVIMYALVMSMRNHLDKVGQGDIEKDLFEATDKVLGVLDWIPTRLLGITYALVGHFGPTFKLWYQNLFTGIEHTREQSAECGLVALNFVDQSNQPATDDQVSAVQSLINRSLFVWVVVIALFTIGMWLG